MAKLEPRSSYCEQSGRKLLLHGNEKQPGGWVGGWVAEGSSGSKTLALVKTFTLLDYHRTVRVAPPTEQLNPG